MILFYFICLKFNFSNMSDSFPDYDRFRYVVVYISGNTVKCTVKCAVVICYMIDLRCVELYMLV